MTLYTVQYLGNPVEFFTMRSRVIAVLPAEKPTTFESRTMAELHAIGGGLEPGATEIVLTSENTLTA